MEREPQKSDFVQNQTRNLVAKLTANTPALWGKMSAQHMVEHLGVMYYVSTGKRPVPTFTPEDKLERSRQFLMSSKPFKRNVKVPTVPENPPPHKYKNLDEARNKLNQQIDAFYAVFEEEDKIVNHPAFGPLNLAGWEQFHYKHNRHHLEQFGLIEATEEG